MVSFIFIILFSLCFSLYVDQLEQLVIRNDLRVRKQVPGESYLLMTPDKREPIKSYVLMTPDIHDGTRVDLASNILSLNQTLYLTSAKIHLPHYSNLRKRETSEQSYLAHPRSSLVIGNRSLCKNTPFKKYNENVSINMFQLLAKTEMFSKVDAIVCMFYPAICQNYVALNKTIIYMPAHRFFIKRCTKNDIDSYFYWMFNSKSSKIVVAAGQYDAEYINYFTGKKIPYIIASTILTYPNPPLNSSRRMNIVAPFKEEGTKWLPILRKNAREMNYKYPFASIRSFKHPFSLDELASFQSVIVFPYAVLSYYLCDIITSTIPMFVPSPEFILDYNLMHDYRNTGKYCPQNAYQPPKSNLTRHPYSPEDNSRDARLYWLQFASFYTPCVTVFSSFEDLFKKLQSTDFNKVRQCNREYRQTILNHNRKQWEAILQQIDQGRIIPESYSDFLKWENRSSVY